LSTIFPAKSKKTSRKILLPLLCSFLMPGISLLNTNVFSAAVEPRRIIGSWITGFIFLLLLWAVDQWIADRFKKARRPPALRLAVQTLVNILLILAFIRFVDLLDFHINIQSSHILSFIKLTLASLVILSVQATLASLAEKEDILLANAELQNENLRTRFEVLKQQVNPHFLFNALGTLRIMIREKDDRAEQFILTLSDLYRQLLGKNTSQTVTLDEELEILRSYIYMLQARFESLLHIDIDIWPDSLACKIPAFSLQLLVENCIKHNIISSAKPLYIRILQQKEDTVLIENNLQTKPSADESSGIGLDNLRKRYELLQVRNGVTIQHTDTKFSVTLQLLQP
jgi:two-component system LytT family sensor kinase